MNYFQKNTVRRTWTLGWALVAVMMTFLGGCKKRPSPLRDGLGLEDGHLCESFVNSSVAYGEAYEAYLGNPTVANCQALKSAGDNFMKEAKTCSFVTPEQRKAAEEQRAEWQDLDCEQFVENSN